MDLFNYMASCLPEDDSPQSSEVWTTLPTIPNSKWHHVALTRNFGETKFYVDGVEVYEHIKYGTYIENNKTVYWAIPPMNYSIEAKEIIQWCHDTFGANWFRKENKFCFFEEANLTAFGLRWG